MEMWQPDQAVQGPFRIDERDIGPLNRLFSEAFTDRYRRDGLVGVRVPHLNQAVWRYALRDAGEGAMLWRDERNEIVAFNIAHCSGAEGWMGPLAVRPDRQGLGLGREIVMAAIDWLKQRGVRTLGLETMPRTVDNIGFYSRVGFVPGKLTVTMTGEITARSVGVRFRRLAEATPSERRLLIDGCREALQSLAPGYDFSRELILTQDLNLGDTVIVTRGSQVAAFALYHSVPLAEARSAEELRVLKLFADSRESFDRLMVALESAASRLQLRRVAVRCQTAYGDAYRRLIGRGYRVRWTDLRMYLAGYGEPEPQGEAVLFSNWEI
ncbi:dTDP-fucosamine acetyltransferase [bacterium HR33]|nr:dTDP-fucosamine acetyltransferase [bacterium HR33]